MPYVSSSAPLPTNSLVPGPPVIDMQRVGANFQASREGRERVYANIPTAASIWNLGPGLAKDAQNILDQSEQARQAVLIGMELPQPLSDALIGQEISLAQIQASAPVVVSINGAPGGGVGLDSSGAALMPAAAPQMVAGVYGSAKADTGKGERGVVSRVSRRLHRPSTERWSGRDLGPGCAYGGGSSDSPPVAGPDWGDATAAPMASGGGVGPWAMVGFAFAAIGLASLVKGRR
jgi:hypothetical protein